MNVLIRSQLNAETGGGTLVSILIDSFTEAMPCEEEGIDIKFSSRANASYLDASCLEVLRGGVCKCGMLC